MTMYYIATNFHVFMVTVSYIIVKRFAHIDLIVSRQPHILFNLLFNFFFSRGGSRISPADKHVSIGV